MVIIFLGGDIPDFNLNNPGAFQVVGESTLLFENLDFPWTSKGFDEAGVVLCFLTSAYLP